MSERAIVTGASGFVGQVLVRHLEVAGWTVMACGYLPGGGVLPCDVRDRRQLVAVFEAAGAVIRGSYDKIHRDTGWSPEHMLESTLKDLRAFWWEKMNS